jgi:hypothetical protein
MINQAGLFGPTPTRFDEDALVAGMDRHNDSGSFNAMVIAGAMQKLTAWWSQQ